MVQIQAQTDVLSKIDSSSSSFEKTGNPPERHPSLDRVSSDNAALLAQALAMSLTHLDEDRAADIIGVQERTSDAMAPQSTYH